MNDFLNHLSANDNDIYDLLLSGKQRLTESVLHELARDRGIFKSVHDSRESLADYLSLLPHDYHDVMGIVQKREPSHRRERTTSVRLNSELTLEELRIAADEYAKMAGITEKVTHRPKGTKGFALNVEYDEFNHSRTRLLQKERHQAGIEFIVENGQTVIRLPATSKANSIITALKENIEQKRKGTITEDIIQLNGLTTPASRSKFFTRLISTLEGFKLKNVMNLKVSSLGSESGENENNDFDIDDEESSDGVRTEMFAAVVHSMALSGQNLVQSQEYKDITKRGFFITSITWRSEQSSDPLDVIQFEAGFEDKKNGTGFRYSIQGAFRSYKGIHRKTIAPVSDFEKERFFSLLESTARKVLSDLLVELSDDILSDVELETEK